MRIAVPDTPSHRQTLSLDPLVRSHILSPMSILIAPEAEASRAIMSLYKALYDFPRFPDASYLFEEMIGLTFLSRGILAKRSCTNYKKDGKKPGTYPAAVSPPPKPGPPVSTLSRLDVFRSVISFAAF